MRTICYAARVARHSASRRPASRRPTISIIGPGNLGTALALTLSAARYPIASIAVRARSKGLRPARSLAKRVGATLVMLGQESIAGDIVWITVPDDAIGNVAHSLSQSGEWTAKLVFHSSGALISDELEPLREKGARVASVHPMMTFVRGQLPRMAGVAFALEGDAAAVRAARAIVNQLGGKPFVIKKESKVLYHAFGSFASPLVIALMATMERVGQEAGIPRQDIKRVMEPLLQQTLLNYLERDAASAFSGPLVRGDVATVRRHLAALGKLPEVKDVYLALARAATKALPIRNRHKIRRELAR